MGPGGHLEKPNEMMEVQGTSKNQFRWLFEAPCGALSIGVGGYKSTDYVLADHVPSPKPPSR